MGYIDVSEQALTFLMSMALGVVLCLLYDLVRVLHSTCIKGFFEVLVCDLLFWGIAAVITYCFLIIRCQGSVRGFVLIGQLIGAVVTRFTLSRIFLLVLTKLFYCISRFFSMIRGLLAKVFRVPKNILKKMLYNAKKGLQHKALLLYNYKKLKAKNSEGESAPPM